MQTKLEKQLKALAKLESLIPEEFRDVHNGNTVAAEKQFIKELNEKNKALGISQQLTRMHVSWGPNANKMTKQQLVNYLWEVEHAPKTLMPPSEIDKK